MKNKTKKQDTLEKEVKKIIKLDTLQKEAEKIAGILEGRLRYLIRGMKNFSFYKAGEGVKGGYYCKFGYYFGVRVSRKRCNDLEEIVQKEKYSTEKTVDYYSIRVYYDDNNMPKIIALSHEGVSWTARKEPGKREYRVSRGYEVFTAEQPL